MIRFMPDSWWDVVMRPLDMISPEANIYVEVAAPDLRLAAAVLLGVAVIAWGRRVQADRRPALALFGVTLLALVPWLATSGNGRYFTPFLLLLGPLCIGLVRLLPLTTGAKFMTAGLLLAGQAFLVHESSPWGNWGLVAWRDAPYFQVSKIPPEPRSYVTVTPISYSLIAPQFPQQSRWMNASIPLNGGRERGYAREWLGRSQSLTLLAPTLPTHMAPDFQPSDDVVKVFNNLVADRGLSVPEGSRCEFMPSKGLVLMAFGRKPVDPSKDMSRFGFWSCPLAYDPAKFGGTKDAPVQDSEVEAVFDAVEKLCPRFFRPGEARTQPMEEGATRHYSLSDTRVYVLDDGRVLYKFWRSINAVQIGTKADVLAGRAQVDCSRIRASTWRSGGP